MDQVNAIVTKANPDATKVTGPEQITHQPDTPYNGLAAPCNQVLPLYFAAGEPRFSSYAKWTAAGQGNTFVNQLVAEYANAAQANTRFAELAKDIPACANAAGVNRDDGLVLTVGEITPNSVQFQQRATGTNRQLANSHVTSTEYRLVGNSIIAVSATEPAAVVTTIADQLGNRLGG